MPIENDALSSAVMSLFGFVLVVLLVFYARRYLWKRRRRGFLPSYGSLGNAFQQSQAIAKPQIEHSLEQQQKEKTSEDDAGEPDDPAGQYRRRMTAVDEGGGGAG